MSQSELKGMLSAKFLKDRSCGGPEVLLMSSSGPLIDNVDGLGPFLQSSHSSCPDRHYIQRCCKGKGYTEYFNNKHVEHS